MPVSSSAPPGRHERLKAMGEKLKSTWQGLTPRRKAAVLGGRGAFILFSFALCCGTCGVFGPRKDGNSAQAKSDSGNSSEPTPVVGKKPRPAKNGKIGRTADGPDPDLMDMEQRYKALVSRIRPGMKTDQVEAILGTPDDTEEKDLGDFNPQKAGQTLEIWTWRGDREDQPSILLSFVNGKLQDGGTPGYDIRKGFKSKLPSNMDPNEKKRLKDAAKKLGIESDDD